MQISKKLFLLLVLLLLINFCLATSTPQHSSTTSTICDKLKIQTLPFSPNPNSTALSSVKPIVICKSRTLYHNNRTSSNLFPASYTNYKCKSLIFQNLTCLHACVASVQEPKFEGLRSSSSCILIDDLTARHGSRDDLNCSCDRVVHGKSSDGNYGGGYKLRTRMSFDIPDHVPNICDECQKPNGNCGAGLRCICHPKQCKNKVISNGGSINTLGSIIVSLLPIVAAIVLVVNP